MTTKTLSEQKPDGYVGYKKNAQGLQSIKVFSFAKTKTECWDRLGQCAMGVSDYVKGNVRRQLYSKDWRIRPVKLVFLDEVENES